MVDDPDLDTYVGGVVRSDDGRRVGTIVDVDGEDRRFYLEPSDELDVNTWEGLGWHTADEYDANWEDLDYDLWRAGDADLPLDYDEWPFTLAADRLADDDTGDDADEDGLRLRE